jgi:glutathione S-transferase
VPHYELYWSPGTCARVPFVALEEIGEPFRVNVVDRVTGGGTSFKDLVAARQAYSSGVNPKGKVPALASEGQIITENPALLTYLAGRHPEVGLLPNGSPKLEREALELMSWFAAGIHPAITRQRFPMAFCDEPGAFDSVRKKGRALLEENFAILEKRLAGREWLFDDWTIVDAYLLWLWFRATGAGMDRGAFPGCAAHALRCEARPTVAKVLDREESEWKLFEEAGGVPDFIPPYQVGRAPTEQVDL